MKDGGAFDRLICKLHFTSRLIAIIIDKAHCVSLWAHFENSIKNSGD